MKVLLADDHWIVRDSLKHAMRSVSPSFEALEASSFDEALDLLSQHPDTALMLIDLVMPGFTEFNGLRMLRSRYPDIPIAVISVHEDRDHVVRAIEEGVIGYIPKSASGTEVLRALTLVLSGDVSFPRRILQSARQSEPAAPAASLGPDGVEVPETSLTPRESQVFRLASSGHSNIDIAERLGMRPNTVRVHLRNLGMKLSAGAERSRSSAAVLGRLRKSE